MIQHLDHKIRKLLFVMMGLIITCIVIIINLVMYDINVQAVKDNMRERIIDIGLENIISSQYDGSELENLEFAAVQVPRNKEDFAPKLLVNQLVDIPDQTLLEYADRIQKSGKEEIRLPGLIYIIKRKNNVGKAVIFMPKREVIRRFTPIIVTSLIAEAIVLILLLCVSKKISKLLVKPVDDMVQAEKKFISYASHELKTPLAVIMANTDLLTDSIGDEKHLNYIKAETERMNHLIIQMLTLAKLDLVDEFYDKTSFSLEEALLEIVYPFESIAYEKSKQLTIDIQNGMPFMGDRQQIQRVVSILLDNALSYSDSDGTIKISACKKSGKYRIQVSNTGEEIPKDIQKILFERFYRQNHAQANNEEHFGLGLAIAYEIVKKHRGTIGVNSNHGINCFTVLLPDGAA